MDNTARVWMTREALAQIAALLLAIADIAEWAAFAPRSIRVLVLSALSRADAVATEFVLDTAAAQGLQWSPAVTPSGRGFEPADAMALAISLRTLALALQTLAASLPELPFDDDNFATGEWAERPCSGIGADAFIKSGARRYSGEPRDTS